MTTRAAVFVRQSPDGVPELAAGDVDLAGANQGQLRVRNSNAHPLGPLTPSAVAQNGGGPARGGGANTAEDDQEEKLRISSLKRVPELLGVTREVPEHGGGSEVEGGALATEELAGAEDENDDNAA